MAPSHVADTNTQLLAAGAATVSQACVLPSEDVKERSPLRNSNCQLFNEPLPSGFATIEPLFVVALYQSVMVKAVLVVRGALFDTSTRLFDPLKLRQLPALQLLPPIQIGPPTRTPVFPFPELSVTVAPFPSLKGQYPTRPGTTARKGKGVAELPLGIIQAQIRLATEARISKWTTDLFGKTPPLPLEPRKIHPAEFRCTGRRSDGFLLLRIALRTCGLKHILCHCSDLAFLSPMRVRRGSHPAIAKTHDSFSDVKRLF